MLSIMPQSAKADYSNAQFDDRRPGTEKSTRPQTGNSSLPPTGNGNSRPATGRQTPGTRPTSAAIRQVSAANSADIHAAAVVTRLGSSRYGRSTSPAPSGAGGGRSSRTRSRRAQSPGATMQAWTSAPSSRRGSITYSEDDSTATPRVIPPAETQAWAAFESSIKEISDDTMYFTTKQQRNFRSSDAFKQVLTDINYVPVVEITSRDDDDVSILSFRPGSVAGDGTNEGSIAPSGTDAEWAERQSVLSAVDDDCLSVSRAGTALGRKSPGVTFRDRSGNPDYTASQTRLSPAEEEPESESIPEVGRARGTLLPVADVFSDPKEMRNELYQRYLHRPETWTKGLTQHLHKTITRERLPASKTWHTTQIFRPKSAVVNGSRFDNNTSVRFKRIQSAHGGLPSLRIHDQNRFEARRGSSAKYIR